MDLREKRIQELLEGDLTDNNFIAELMHVSFNEPDDLIRGIALCHLKEKSPKIIQRLLLEIEWVKTIG